MYSAEFVDLEDDKDKEPSKVDKFLTGFWVTSCRMC